MYDPSVQRALMTKLARWRSLPQGDLLDMLSPVDRLRYRSDALRDLEADRLVSIVMRGDEPVVTITEAGDAWLAGKPGQ